jgi:small acid-soluble spore protein E (minor gamma-type SASP)
MNMIKIVNKFVLEVSNMPQRIHQLAGIAQQSLLQIQQIAQFLAQNERNNAVQLQNTNEQQIPNLAPALAQRELVAANQLQQIQQLAQQLQTQLGASQYTTPAQQFQQGNQFASFQTEFASDNNIAEVINQSEQQNQQ